MLHVKSLENKGIDERKFFSHKNIEVGVIMRKKMLGFWKISTVVHSLPEDN